MKISELIAKLEEQKKEYGDTEILLSIYDDCEDLYFDEEPKAVFPELDDDDHRWIIISTEENKGE